jgi:hypothetical protein
MAFILRFSVLVLLSLSAAWGSSFHGRPDVTCDLSDPAASGLVVVSASTPASGEATDPISIWFHFNLVDRSTFSDETVMIAREQFFKDVPSDFDGPFGRLYVLKLKAGEYEFRSWVFTQARSGAQTVPHTRKKPQTTLPFKVEAGRVTYLGSFAPSMISGHELSVTVVDQNKRDMQALTKKCPDMDMSIVDSKPIKPGPWN